MSKLEQIALEVDDTIEAEKYQEDWCAAGDAANKAVEWARDRDVVVETMLQCQALTAAAVEGASGAGRSFSTLADLRTHLETALDDWVLWGLGSEEGVDFAVWDFYPCDGHLAFIVAREGADVLVWETNTN